MVARRLFHRLSCLRSIMCLALIAHRAHAAYPLIIAANRDEFHARPTAPAQWWESGILAGRDLEAGGTWFGCRRNARFALLTNYRDGRTPRGRGRSRGLLVTDALKAEHSALDTALALDADAAAYDGFNLLCGDRENLACLSNRDGGARALAPGVYGLSNHLLDTPWPKLQLTKNRFLQWLSDGAEDIDALFHLLRDPSRPQDHELPETGISLEWERLLAAAFIVSADYGTRSSTVMRVDATGGVEFIERSFDARGEVSGEVAFNFAAG